MNEGKDRSAVSNEVPRCSVCNQTFHSQQEFDEHNRQRHGQGRMTDEGQAGSGRMTEGQFGRGSTGARDFESGTDPHAGRNQEQQRKGPTTVNNEPEQEQDQPARKKRAAR